MPLIHTQVFTIADVRVLADLTPRTAEEWYRQGIIRASIRSGTQGTERLFNFGDLLAAHLASSLRHAGFALDVIRKAVDVYYSTRWGDGQYVLTVVDSTVSVETPAAVHEMLERGVPVAHVNLLQAAVDLRKEVDSQIETVTNAEWN